MDILGILSSPILGFVGTVFSLILAYVFYAKGKRDKEPHWAIQTVNLFTDHSSSVDGLEITYKGEKVRDLSVSKVVFWNRGALTIDKIDLTSQDPLRIEIKGESRILSAKLIASNNGASLPSLVGLTEVGLTDNKIVLAFEYLDKGHGFVVQIIHEGSSSQDLEVRGSIKGVTEIHRTNPSTFVSQSKASRVRELKETLLAGAFVTILGVIALCANIFFESEALRSTKVILFLIGSLSVVGAVPQVFTILYQSRKQAPAGLEAFYSDPRRTT